MMLPKVVEVSTTSKTTMMVKATSEDIQGFQSYTIRNMDNHVFTENDTEQYKMLSIKDAPLDNRMKFLDVMCFPVLYPIGKFGEHHDRQVKISHGEFIKSRLLNKDSRFRKDPQYIFYLLWQKDMRKLSAGVYNMLLSQVGSFPYLLVACLSRLKQLILRSRLASAPCCSLSEVLSSIGS